MRKATLILFVVAGLVLQVTGQDLTSKFDAEKMRQRVKRLSADDFEGRGPGTDGGRRAAQYIADELKSSGVRPGNNGSYFQNVPLIGVKADRSTVLAVRGKKGLVSFRFGSDFVVTTGTQTSNVSVNSAEVVFVGYGIDAPSYRWNDYKGDPEQYRGKILLMMVNDPPATTSEPNLFGGKALTYFGRWTYKYEEAARRGAAGVILIHTTDSAGYGWNVIETSNGNWRYEIKRGSDTDAPFLKIRSWVTNEAAEKMMKLARLDLDDLRKKAQNREFIPVNTGLRVDLTLDSELKEFSSPNVVGIVKGNDIRRSNEYVIYTAHWDHLGIGPDGKDGDKIYNGAYDNASGVAAVLGIAEAVAGLSKQHRPKRSMLFLFPTAEEQGLLGAEYYSHFPLVPLAKTAANINLDGVNFFGKTTDFMPLGAERSELSTYINAAAKERNMTVEGDARPEQGFFFRSDHFPFARVGVPSVSLQHGDMFVPPLKRDAEEFFKEYTGKYYHQTSDEYHDWWDMSAMIQEAELALLIGIKVANAWAMPRFLPTDEFAAADALRFRK
jgi:Zn-dependent M28 family amino/carboxypeptidase